MIFTASFGAGAMVNSHLDAILSFLHRFQSKCILTDYTQVMRLFEHIHMYLRVLFSNELQVCTQ